MPANVFKSVLAEVEWEVGMKRGLHERVNLVTRRKAESALTAAIAKRLLSN